MDGAAGADQYSRKPMSVYEVHLGSWRRDNNGEPLTYRELAKELVDYVKTMGYTHIELMPIAEHPILAVLGLSGDRLFCAHCRFGSPQDFMYFVDSCHQAGIGVIIDWVPAHFPKDAHGLASSMGRRSTSTKIRGWASIAIGAP